MDKAIAKQIVDNNLNTLIDLLKIKSIYNETSASKTMPFGKGVYDALFFMEELAKKDGFIVTNYDNQAISFEIGSGESRIDIASHLDVVYAKDDAFNIRLEDGLLYGRGTSDMKVPMFMTYLALKELKNKYSSSNKRLRIVLGSDEERTMNDMKHYISVAGYPDFAFTPDGTFPMGIGEKGALMWTLEGKYSGVISSFDGGSQCNIISPFATCVLNDNDNLERINKYIVENNINGKAYIENNKTIISIKGKAAHASRPKEGHNATIDLLRIIKDIYNDELCTNLYGIFSNSYGKGFDSFVSEDKYRSLTVNLGRLTIENNNVFGQVDSRYPYGTNAEDLTNRIKNKCIINASLDYNDEPTECDINDPYVKCMLDKYYEITNDNNEPIISGGVSYSKVFKHCVSFGPNELNKPSLAHQENEYVEMEDVYKWFVVYYSVMESLLLME